MEKSHIIQPNLKHADKTLPGNLALLIRSRAKECPDVVAQASKDADGKFVNYTYKKVYDEVLTFALALQSIGIKKGAHVGLISDNRKEWLITDLAILSLAAADVPRGTDSTGTEIRYILSFSECTHSIFENMTQFEKVLEKIKEVPKLKSAIIYDGWTEENAKKAKKAGIELFSYEQLMKKGLEINPEKKKDIEKIADGIKGEDLATIIFTSGTTGVPKGVMLSHRNYLSQCEVISGVLTSKAGDMWLSVLPVWHSFERFIQYSTITFRSGIAYSKPVASVMLADMAVIRPEWMCGVPRLWEALAQGVYRAMKKDGGIKLKLFNFFVGVGKKHAVAKEHVLGHVCRFTKRSRLLDFLKGIIPLILLTPLDALGNKLIYSKIRARLGGRMVAAISGGGALQPNTDLFYRAIKFKLLEGYGITEAAPVLSVRDVNTPRPGCVGVVYPSSAIKVVAEKEGKIVDGIGLPPGQKGLILAKGEQIMMGYYKRDDLTKEVIDKDGWLNTGDLGMLTFDNEISITGRAKDTIVLLGGENIEPASIESALVISEYIETPVVLGQDQKYLAALIVPAKDNIESYAKEHNIAYTSYEKLLESKEIIALIRSELDSRIIEEEGFRPYERISKFALLSESFQVSKELSAKQEMMRHKIVEIYKDKIVPMFS